MGDDQIGVIVLEMGSYIVPFLKIFCIRHRDKLCPLLIQKVEWCYIQETMVFDHLLVHGVGCPAPAIGSIALYYSSIYSLHCILKESRPQVVGCRGLTGAYLDTCLALGIPPHGLIDLEHSSR